MTFDNYYVYQSTPFDLYGTPDFSEIYRVCDKFNFTYFTVISRIFMEKWCQNGVKPVRKWCQN